MFHNVRTKTTLQSVIVTGGLIYLAAVRSVRSTHGNAFMAIIMNIAIIVLMVLAFYLMFTIIGLKSAKLRGDFLLYIMSGIFLYITHIKAVGAIAGAEGPTSPMMLHAPMNTMIAICAAALSTLYIQTLSLLTILFFYHVIFNPVVIAEPIPAYGMFLLAWGSGLSIGLVFLWLKPWFPGFVGFLTPAYQRVSMIASGKLFVANALPNFMLAIFDWHPLFHVIDQIRGFVFINYFPRNSNWEYTLYVMLGFVIIGLMGEFYSRQYSSLSWSARR